MAFTGSGDFMERQMAVRAPCPHCGTSVEFGSGARLAWDTIGAHDQVVMCGRCHSIYEIQMGAGTMRLTKNVTSRYPAAPKKAHRFWRR
jgi:primosomal protein N'